MKANDILTKLKELHKKGSLVKYSGRNSISNLQIQSFNTSHPYTNAGGADFDMSLKEVRMAKSSYNKSNDTAKKTQEKKKESPNLSVGSVVVFKGGSVYVSSDATKPAANRGRSTCKITIINTRSWSKHSYHLISTDGRMVYGWVDKSNIEGVASSGTTSKSNGGTQQVKKSSNNKNRSKSPEVVYYVVKKGDNLYRLVNVTFKDFNTTVNIVMRTNPQAFSRQGDASTLIIGSKLKFQRATTTSNKTHTQSSGASHGGGGGGLKNNTSGGGGKF